MENKEKQASIIFDPMTQTKLQVINGRIVFSLNLNAHTHTEY